MRTERTPRILVVDDDAMMRSMAAGTLRHGGFQIAEAVDGASALAALERDPVELVLLDVMMPDLDGFEVCRRIRSMRGGERVQILMLTGLNDTDSIEQAYAAGATDFITKPINWSLLSHRVRYALRAGASAEAERRVRESLERAQRMAHMGHWEIRGDDGAIACSGELVDILRLDPAQPPLDMAEFLSLVDESDRARVRAARESARRDGQPYQMTFAVRRPDGERRIVYEQAAARFDALGVTFAVDGITQDITDRAEAEQRIRQLAQYDMLTGLPNRWFFAETVTPAMQRARRLGTQCALLHVDMDRFKSVNDALGRAGGDAVLRIIAERIAGVVRASDLASAGTAGDDGFVARFGANAFTVMLLDVGADPDVARVAQRLLDAIEVPLQIDGRELVLSASVGIAMFPRDGEGEVELSRSAEQALYAAKSSGRKQYRFFDEAMHAAASAQLARESELRQAIAQGQLCLHYQPKVNASDGRIVGAEALVRWIHPQRGLIPPGDFIPLAEQSGLIMPLTRWVLDAACADQRRRLDAGLATVPIAVNLAASNFAHDRLLDDLEALLSGYGLGTGWLTLEVTESMLMADIEQAVQRLEALHRRGFTLSLDDFGTGYSSLNYLKRFPIDELKIDRSFIADVASGGRDGALVASIIALAKGLGLSVVAEGVENESQRRFLLAHGCATHQGYHFSRPVPTQAFDGLLASGWIDFGLPARPVA